MEGVRRGRERGRKGRRKRKDGGARDGGSEERKGKREGGGREGGREGEGGGREGGEEGMGKEEGSEKEKGKGGSITFSTEKNVVAINVTRRFCTKIWLWTRKEAIFSLSFPIDWLSRVGVCTHK